MYFEIIKIISLDITRIENWGLDQRVEGLFCSEALMVLIVYSVCASCVLAITSHEDAYELRVGHNLAQDKFEVIGKVQWLERYVLGNTKNAKSVNLSDFMIK